jgi:LmbE family N-acetylglucosaminyl deacetylase
MAKIDKRIGVLTFKRVLVLGAHTDDEFGCSGTIVRLLEGGAEVYCAMLSTCQESVPEGFPKDVLSHEAKKAAEVLGVRENHLLLYDFQVRRFPAVRQEILEELVRLRKKLEPDLVLLPALSDIHQDHHVIAMEGLRAFKFASILGYELPMNTITFQHACFVELKASQVQKKVESLTCYKSQRFRNYANEDFVRSLAKVRGVQAGVDYAEAFEVLRLKL